jgi:hypothetical protein
MKLKRLMLGSLLCLSLSVPSAFACDGGSGMGDSGSGWSFFSFLQHFCDHDRDHDNDNRGGHDRDHNNGGHQCDHSGSSGGSTSTGGGNTSGGTTQYK